MKVKRFFAAFLLLLLATTVTLYLSGKDKVVQADSGTAAAEVSELFNIYYNRGTYRKNTEIKADIDVMKANAAKLGDEAANFFHAGQIPALKRTTDYTPGRLVMTTEANPNGVGYKDEGNNMVRFAVVDGNDKASYTVNNTSVEAYYVTMKDFAEKSITNQYSDTATSIANAVWQEEDGRYSTTDAVVIDAFRLFTAPMWLGKTKKN